MRDAHLTLRLPGALARLLDRIARARGLSKSQLVREAVATYFGGADLERSERTVTGRELAKRWRSFPRLTPEEADELAGDIAKARAELPPVIARWK